MQRALAEVVLAGVAGGALGCWVVLYGFAYAAESLAHSLFPGLVVAAIAGVPLLLGAAPAISLLRWRSPSPRASLASVAGRRSPSW